MDLQHNFSARMRVSKIKSNRWLYFLKMKCLDTLLASSKMADFARDISKRYDAYFIKFDNLWALEWNPYNYEDQALQIARIFGIDSIDTGTFDERAEIIRLAVESVILVRPNPLSSCS
jgi:hypothetical protein